MATPIRVRLLGAAAWGAFPALIQRHAEVGASRQCAPHHFEVAENGRGYWVAEDKEGLIGGVFRTQKDALRFALFEAAGDSACVKVISSPRH